MEGKKFLKLNDIEAYRIAFKLSNQVWDIVLKWDYFAKDTVGKQFVKSVDSISANIAEGFGRYSKKDKVKFFRYSFGSL
jgi:four helix bundle protein